MRILVWVTIALLSATAQAQDNINDGLPRPSIPLSSAGDLDRLGKAYGDLSTSLQQQASRILSRMQKQEVELQQQLSSIDHTEKVIYDASLQQYQQLQEKLKSAVNLVNRNPLKEYIPSLDSLQTALRFLQQPGQFNIPTTQLSKIQQLSGQITSFETRLQQANEINAFLQARKDQLQAQLEKYKMTGQLTRWNKQLYYYQQTIGEYKELLHNKDKLAAKTMAIVENTPGFSRFMQKNSYLSMLFRAPGSNSDSATGQGLPGLQTKEQVNALVTARLGPGSNFAAAATSGDNSHGNSLSGSMAQAQEQMNAWKDKILQSGGGGSAATVPDFQPNSQHSKTFLRRLQLGFDIQSQQSSQWIPSLSTLGLNLGYKLNDKSTVGIGGAYIIGWGQPFNHISLSSQGASLRSFIDWKWKGTWWICGGYEANYFNAFAQLSQLYNISAWQQSALVGLLKQYKAGRRTANIQLLFDMLYRQHIPQSQPVVFRFGYSLN